MVTTQKHAATGLPKTLTTSFRGESQTPYPAFWYQGRPPTTSVATAALTTGSCGSGRPGEGRNRPLCPREGMCARRAVSLPSFSQNKAKNCLSLCSLRDFPSAIEGGREAAGAAEFSSGWRHLSPRRGSRRRKEAARRPFRSDKTGSGGAGAAGKRRGERGGEGKVEFLPPCDQIRVNYPTSRRLAGR